MDDKDEDDAKRIWRGKRRRKEVPYISQKEGGYSWQQRWLPSATSLLMGGK